MLSVQRIKPFYTSHENFRLRLVFAYQYLSIIKGGELFHFIPSEGREIVVNMKSLQVENLGEVFVFQRGTRFLRLPLYQLLLISDLNKHLTIILEGNVDVAAVRNIEIPEFVVLEAQLLITQFERDNTLRMIDVALETDNLNMFNELTEGLS